jgi:hypothetical protein
MTLSPGDPSVPCPGTQTYTASSEKTEAGKDKQSALDAARKAADADNDLELARIACAGGCELVPDKSPNVDVGDPVFTPVKDAHDKVVGYRCTASRKQVWKVECKERPAHAPATHRSGAEQPHR